MGLVAVGGFAGAACSDDGSMQGAGHADEARGGAGGSGPVLEPEESCSTIDVERAGVTFTFAFDCGGEPCGCGRFVGGDPWVVPSSPGGVVTLTAITPEGEEHGAMDNPALERIGEGPDGFAEEQVQGLVMGYEHYDAAKNVMTQLPFAAPGGTSILKVTTQTEGCGTEAIATGCVSSGAVLTVLDQVPPNQGATVFRPPFHGDEKPLYFTDRVRLERLPSLPQVGGAEGEPVGGPDGFEEWLVPQYELNHNGYFSGEFHRATIPHAAHTPYAADQANDFLEDLTDLFGPQSTDEKRAAAYTLIQRGIDNYGVFRMGVPFGSGAGQHLGKKPPITLFAALYDDPELLETVRAIATDPQYENANFFQEDSQVRAGRGGSPVWGERSADFGDVHWYFTRLFPRLDSNGASGDPYGYIDGPPGGIHPDPDETSDRNYLGVAGGPLISYAFLQQLMPYLRYAAGDEELLTWADRIYSGYGFEGFEGGLWTRPDPCAPVPSVDQSDCDPYRLYSTGVTGCEEYQVSWGPQPDDLGQCIEHAGDPNTDGRMPELHGHRIEFNRLISLVTEHWDTLRTCADPEQASYPCAGLGPAVAD